MLSRQSFEPGTLQFALRQLKTHLFLPVELKFVLQHCCDKDENPRDCVIRNSVDFGNGVLEAGGDAISAIP